MTVPDKPCDTYQPDPGEPDPEMFDSDGWPYCECGWGRAVHDDPDNPDNVCVHCEDTVGWGVKHRTLIDLAGSPTCHANAEGGHALCHPYTESIGIGWQTIVNSHATFTAADLLPLLRANLGEEDLAEFTFGGRLDLAAAVVKLREYGMALEDWRYGRSAAERDDAEVKVASLSDGETNRTFYSNDDLH